MLCYFLGDDSSIQLATWGHTRISSTTRFLHHLNSENNLVAPAEVVVFDEGAPYGILSPEEDCATAFIIYGVISDSVSSLGNISATQGPEISNVAKSIAQWASNSMERNEPEPSLAPYLKAVWIEWFSQAFKDFKRSNISVKTLYTNH